MDNKTCTKCGEEQSVDNFHRDKSRKDGRYPYCKGCTRTRNHKNYYANHEANQKARRNNHISLRYGITTEEYERMLEAQNHRCAICKQPETQKFKGTLRRLAVDHCHDTGNVRALLCQSCNTGIGKLMDDPELMRRAASYIETYATSNRCDHG